LLLVILLERLERESSVLYHPSLPFPHPLYLITITIPIAIQ
jgi:hypothetical protein